MSGAIWSGLLLVGFAFFVWFTVIGWPCFDQLENLIIRSHQEARQTNEQRQVIETNQMALAERKKHIMENLVVKKFIKRDNVLQSDTSTDAKDHQVVDTISEANSVESIEIDIISTARESSMKLEVAASFDSSKIDLTELSSPAQCSICLSNYQVGEIVASSKNSHCTHIFHSECLTKWLMLRNECPICRFDYFNSDYPDKKEEIEDQV